MSQQEHFCADPRDPEAECLLVRFDVSSFGYAPHGYGEHFDPGSGPEFDILLAAEESGADVLAALTPEQVESLEACITENFDFRAARDAERWDPREDF
jgi:hypothetical protein